MREEVESLLTAHEDNADFLSCPAYELAAGMLADETPEFISGQEVDQYKIECFLSSGGMGQIYAAHDKKLGRKVALKFISPEFATDYRRVQRFEQEAMAATSSPWNSLWAPHSGMNWCGDEDSSLRTLWKFLFRSEMRLPAHTQEASFIAISNLKTSCCAPTGT
jgi:serine/threonine protein kinase